MSRNELSNSLLTVKRRIDLLTDMLTSAKELHLSAEGVTGLADELFLTAACLNSALKELDNTSKE